MQQKLVCFNNNEKISFFAWSVIFFFFKTYLLRYSFIIMLHSRQAEIYVQSGAVDFNFNLENVEIRNKKKLKRKWLLSLFQNHN